MEVTFLDVLGWICIVIVVIEIILWFIQVCNPKQQNHKRSGPPSEKFDYCYFENKDHMWLYYNHWEPVEPAKGVIFLCHGICENSSRYGRIAGILNRSGFAVYAMDHRGHGRSDGYRNYINNMQDLVQDICDFAHYIHKKRPELPVFVMGHSMGGMLAIAATHQLGSLVRASVFSAPALSVDPAQSKLYGVVKIIQLLMPKLTVARLDASTLCHDPQVVEEYQGDILNTPGSRKPLPARTGYQLLTAVSATAKLAPEIKVPFLMMQGDEDSVCFPVGAVKFVKEATVSDKELKVWPGLYHEIMNEGDGMEVAQYAADWLKARL